MTDPLGPLIEEGQAALRRGDWETAQRAFEAAGQLDPSAARIENVAQALYLKRDWDAAIEFFERAYAAYRDERDDLGAIRTARTLGFLNAGVRGDGAVAGGWTARAKTLLSGSDVGPEHGWVELNAGMFESHRATRNQRFSDALAIARRFGDIDLEFEALAYLGASMVHDDQIDEGMAMLDEALAAVAGGEVSNFMAIEEIFCQLFSACEHAHDVTRADQWIRVGDEIASRRNLPAVSAFCRTHYGGLLTAAGRWAEADAELSEAARIWATGYVSMRWTALVRLAELRVRQGRFEEAEQLLDGLDVYTEAASPLAAVHAARGDIAVAADVLERAIDQTGADSAFAGALWAHLVEVHLLGDAVLAADAAASRLEEIAVRHGGHYLSAATALARGRVSLASEREDAIGCLRAAVSGFAMARLPMELAASRLDLARALAGTKPEVAVAEAKTALEEFERLEALRHADAAAALLRSLGASVRVGAKGHEALTKRELQVLELLGHGLSNPEIGERLYISRKTVEHHVGSVLSKLQLRSRAEAAAHAARAEGTVKR